jgi:hypothetical protein
MAVSSILVHLFDWLYSNNCSLSFEIDFSRLSDTQIDRALILAFIFSSILHFSWIVVKLCLELARFKVEIVLIIVVLRIELKKETAKIFCSTA